MHPTLNRLLSEYAEDHQHPMNRATHKIGVPLVFFHIVAMLDWIHLFPGIQVHTAGDGVLALSLGHLFALGVMVWYLKLHVRLALVVGVFALFCFVLAPYTSLPWVIGITVVAWVLQFIGHGVYEKRAPAFFRNLLQLLVGPLFFAAIFMGLWPNHQEKLS